jgi:hypothetical protein
MPLLIFVVKVREATALVEVNNLRNYLIEQLHDFENKLKI